MIYLVGDGQWRVDQGEVSSESSRRTQDWPNEDFHRSRQQGPPNTGQTGQEIAKGGEWPGSRGLGSAGLREWKDHSPRGMQVHPANRLVSREQADGEREREKESAQQGCTEPEFSDHPFHRDLCRAVRSSVCVEVRSWRYTLMCNSIATIFLRKSTEFCGNVEKGSCKFGGYKILLEKRHI